HLAGPLGKLAEERLIVDCRSAAYAAAFRPSGAAAERTAAVRVLKETASGGTVKRSVVSHMAKATRGAIAHTLLAQGRSPGTPAGPGRPRRADPARARRPGIGAGRRRHRLRPPSALPRAPLRRPPAAT